MFFLCGKEGHIKPHYPENKKVNQLEVDNYNIKEHILDVEEIRKVDQ